MWRQRIRERTNDGTIPTFRSPISNMLLLFLTINIFCKVLVSCASTSPAQNESNRELMSAMTDKEVLHKLFVDTTGSRWKINTNWMSTESICDWYGVTCAENEENRVLEINLSQNGLFGMLPMTLLLQMPKLSLLHLGGNHQLQIPDDIDEEYVYDVNKEEIKSSFLAFIDVSQTQLSSLSGIIGSLDTPVKLNLPSLTTLIVSECNLQGSLSEKTHLVRFSSTLEHLEMDDNDFYGTIPDWIGEMDKLKFLSINQNDLEGELPKSIGKLKHLKTLKLQNNRLSGDIPAQAFDGFLELIELNLGGNIRQNEPGFIGDLPSFKNLKNLQRLVLDHNSIDGTIPDNFLAEVDPKIFDYALLGSNSISGTIPSILKKFSPQSIHLEDNFITGISEELCDPSRGGLVTKFGCAAILCPPNSYHRIGRQETENEGCHYCPQNDFFGAIQCGGVQKPTNSPTNFPTKNLEEDHEKVILQLLYDKSGGQGWTYKWDMEALVSLDGSICELFGVDCAKGSDGKEIESVEYLLLTGNNLAGEIPMEIFNLPNLKSLSLSRNDIMMTFEGIENARKLESLDLASTMLYDLAGIENAPGLLDIHLESNSLEGKFPEELSKLKKLQTLRLDYNNISGEIPIDIGDMVELKFLSIDYNSLSGSLPKELGLLNQLTKLRLKENSLTGNINIAILGLTSLSFLDLSHQIGNGGDGFSGELPDFKGFPHLRRLDLSENSFTGTIPGTFLNGQDKASFEFVNLSGNKLKGTVPASLAGFHDIYLQDNQFTDIADEVCDEKWGGPISQFACAAVLCPKGTYNLLGRQQSYDRKCEECPSAIFLGSTHCSGGSNDFPTVAPAISTTSEYDILQELYSACDGPSWSETGNWLTEETVCSWEGIRCNDMGNVVGITLRSNGLTGTPPPRIFELPFLETLNFDGNYISFSFQGIENAKVLSTLDLSNTNLASLEGLEKALVNDLYLTSNNLIGEFPAQILELVELKRLSLAMNNLSGTIPDSAKVLNKLEFLSLHNNDFSGTLPEFLGDFKNLLFLLAQENKIEGKIPASFEKLDNLWFLDLSNMGLTGTLPSFSTFADIRRLDLHGNQLSGEIPDDLLRDANPETFEYIDVSSNNLTGEIPGSLKKFPIDDIYFSDNKITAIDNELCDEGLGGAVSNYGCNAVLCEPHTYNSLGKQESVGTTCEKCPHGTDFYGAIYCIDEGSMTPVPTMAPQEVPDGFLSELQILEIIYDKCGGIHWSRNDKWKDPFISHCEWFGIRCVDTSEGFLTIASIMLSSNNLIGSMPNEIFQLPFLESIILDKNDILFNFEGIGNLKHLEDLILSETRLVSIQGISGAISLKNVRLNGLGLDGKFPHEITLLKNLEYLSMDNNLLTGSIPEDISLLEKLISLSIARNGITGKLPDALSKLSNLVTLQLQQNSLSGSLAKLDGLINLAYLDLSFQNIDGELPDFANFKNFRQLDLSNNKLVGSIPRTFLASVNPTFLELVDLGFNLIRGIIPKEVAHLGIIIGLENNEITKIAPEICALSDFGCDGILCQPGTCNCRGREDTGSPCTQCSNHDSEFFGDTYCEDDSKDDYLDDMDYSEKDILEKLYYSTGGEEWQNNDNWLTDATICDWGGITCVDKVESVEAIHLGSNNVHGIPPSEIFNLPNLKSLVLYNNPLDGFNFIGIQQAEKLTELMLHSTGISKFEGIGEAPNLKKLNLSYNNLIGDPYEITSLKTLTYLSLCNNRLFGTVPEGIKYMDQLEVLLLESNSFSGDLSSIQVPTSLRILDLSKNELNGPIPKNFLNGIPNDSMLDVYLDRNLLTGNIPNQLGQFEMLNIRLNDNFFQGIDGSLCTKQRWNDGDVGDYKCNAIMCPKGTWSPVGRMTKDYSCQLCSSAMYYGASECYGIVYEESSGSHYLSIHFGLLLVTVLSFVSIVL